VENRLSPDEAFELLGVSPIGSLSDIRSAFRAEVLLTHPDHAGAVNHDRTLLLLEAYRVALVEAETHGSTTSPVVADEVGPTAWLIDQDTIALACPHEEAFIRLLDVGQSLGVITYLDRQGELLEVLLRTNLGDTISLVISFQGRSEWVEAFVTLAVLDRAKHELPTVEHITELLLHRLRVDW
jgi:hypothetical protein